MMKSWIGKVGLSCMLALILLFVSACSSQITTPNNAEGSEDQKGNTEEKTKITWLQWWKGEQGVAGEELFANIESGFEEANPTIDLVIENLPFNEVHTKILSTHAGGIAPDVIALSSPWVAEFAAAGITSPLDDYFKAQSEEFQENNSGPYWSPWQGKHYAMGIMTGNTALFYNKRMLEEANVEPPTTWEEYLEASIALTDSSKNQYALTGNIASEPASTINTEVWPFIYQAGGTLIEDGKAAFNSPEGVKALEFYKSMIKDHKVATPGELSATEQDKRANFSAENTAFMFDGPWGIGIQRSANPDLNFGVIPMVKGETTGTIAGGGALAITSNSKNKDAAWKFIEYMVQPDIQEAWAKAANQLPHNKAALDADFIQNDPLLKVFAEQSIEVNPINPDLQMPESTNMRKIMINEVQSYLMGDKTAQEALDDAAAGWNEVFDKYK
jgi:multiple sugar transport system substrate-binding protein